MVAEYATLHRIAPSVSAPNTEYAIRRHRNSQLPSKSGEDRGVVLERLMTPFLLHSDEMLDLHCNYRALVFQERKFIQSFYRVFEDLLAST